MFCFLIHHHSIHVSLHLKKALPDRGFGASKMDVCSILFFAHSVPTLTVVLVFMWWPLMDRIFNFKIRYYSIVIAWRRRSLKQRLRKLEQRTRFCRQLMVARAWWKIQV